MRVGVVVGGGTADAESNVPSPESPQLAIVLSVFRLLPGMLHFQFLLS